MYNFIDQNISLLYIFIIRHNIIRQIHGEILLLFFVRSTVTIYKCPSIHVHYCYFVRRSESVNALR